MKSLAIWLDENSIAPQNDSIEMHVNLWKIATKKNGYRRFIDIGINLLDPQTLNRLRIYVPVKLEANNVFDIVGSFINDNSLICTLFNENYRSIHKPNSKAHSIHDNSGSFKFDIYELDQSNFHLEHRYNGTIINVMISNTSPTYIRCRIDNTFCDQIVNIQRPSNSFFQSAFSKIEITDFRVNDVRDLNNSLLEEMNKEKIPQISKGHFFYMISSNEEVINYQIPFINCRILEKQKWLKYIGENSLKQDEEVLAYHWKISNNNFNIFVKTKFENNNWKTILWYLFVLLLLTILFDRISDYINHSLDNALTYASYIIHKT